MSDEEGVGFFEASARGELRIQACGACGRLRHPPRPMCPWCRSVEREWRPVSGTGTVWSFVVPHPPLLPAFAEKSPYNVIVVALDDDRTVRLVGNLVASPDGDINEIDPHSIDIGEPVSVVFPPAGDDELVRPQWVRR